MLIVLLLCNRYPIHFHFCKEILCGFYVCSFCKLVAHLNPSICSRIRIGGDLSGSVVAKNTIRQSNQRCLAAHGTSNLEILQNIAYDVYGHCFFTEDGIETGNRFIQNLGAQIKIPERLIDIDGVAESDNEPTVFWITNPNNTFVNNVAAGSQSVGFWIHPFIRGERAHLFPGYDPAYEALGTFDQNVAHSCGEGSASFLGAMRTYAPDRYVRGKARSLELCCCRR